MSKRFTDSEKWKKLWFRKLPPIYKCLWIYICDNCNLGGVWDVDFESASFFIDTDIDIDNAKKLLKKQYEELNDGTKWFIKDFIFFQYGELKDNNNLHRAVISSMKNSGVFQGYVRGRYTPLVKVKVKVRGKGKGKGRERDKGRSRGKGRDRGKGRSRGKGNIENIFIKEIIDDLNFVLDTNYKSKTKNTILLIEARLKEGFTIEDFKIVHRKMLKSWGNSSKMCKFLRPGTLYNGEKFESYLNQIELTTKLSESGIQAYIVGKNWLKKELEKDMEIKNVG